VVAFYTAVHLIERLRALDGSHSTDHQTRLIYVQSNHRPIHDDFKQLYNASLLARYDSNSDFFAKFANSDVKTVLIDQHLTAIEKYVDQYVKDHSPPRVAPEKPK
jgi:hypothetical protein